ncbi:NAD(P)H-flavin reductase [Alishewanella longhuensis]|uniref:NAD(P)H-flavin reductase n=1 Tax=Alishewanella longhuensis TaxID=1091037 RepID=A0ABQ3L2L2_9ALTE|nr:NAD(P)H-flavin reductase [Alishewanella longhuensis]GHG75883.1 NAD(P)H-flavin reductase [Alishewanella longhuensis]
MNAIACQVVSIEALTPVVSKVLLAPSMPVQFTAGQYLQLCITPTDKRPFSIASIPEQALLELHIGTPEGDSWSSVAMSHLQQQHALAAPVQVEVGLGQAQWHAQSDRPVILLAGGTGFSYVYSIAMAIEAAKQNKPVFLYWGVRNEQALYYQAELEQWAATNSKFRFIPVVQQAATSWSGRTGLVHEAVLHDFVSLEAYDIYMAGPFAMAGVAREAFAEQGGQREHMFADAFAYI